MKRLLYAAALILMFCIDSYSQTINNVPLKDIDSKHIMIVGIGTFMSNSVKVQVDFGQKVEALLFKNKEMAVKDENGSPVIFNSMIDALNFFEKNNYEFVNAYAFTESTGMGKASNVFHWILRKK